MSALLSATGGAGSVGAFFGGFLRRLGLALSVSPSGSASACEDSVAGPGAKMEVGAGTGEPAGTMMPGGAADAGAGALVPLPFGAAVDGDVVTGANSWRT